MSERQHIKQKRQYKENKKRTKKNTKKKVVHTPSLYEAVARLRMTINPSECAEKIASTGNCGEFTSFIEAVIVIVGGEEESCSCPRSRSRCRARCRLGEVIIGQCPCPCPCPCCPCCPPDFDGRDLREEVPPGSGIRPL
jgi:hypothetical protein